MTTIDKKTLFQELDVKPGDTYQKTISVKNTTGKDCQLTLLVRPKDATEPKSLDEVLFTVIRANGTDYFGNFLVSGWAGSDKTLADLLATERINLGTLSNGQSRDYDWIVSIDSSVGNEYQQSSIKFDFDINFSCGNPDHHHTPTPTPKPTFGHHFDHYKNFFKHWWDGFRTNNIISNWFKKNHR
ncbi:hypothetical protein GYA49_05525 [Candidatus Beckwithbacteria bacterium]|nr:hypothetical protein [Candidatus Beckwithbacteria bacterium]